MTDASKITQAHAQAIYEDNDDERQGIVVIDGERFAWWTDGKTRVWFYDPDAEQEASGEDTIKRFETDAEVYEVTW